jgi:hypothetical protein
MNTQKLLKLVSSIALASCFAAPAHAGFITGGIEFSGSVRLTGAPGIDTKTQAGFLAATGIDFLIATTNYFTQTGDYSDVQGGISTAYNDFTFNVFNGPVNPLWKFTDPDDSKTYSFALNSISIKTHDGDFLTLSGKGML